jgi:hypothetical protein
MTVAAHDDIDPDRLLFIRSLRVIGREAKGSTDFSRCASMGGGFGAEHAATCSSYDSRTSSTSCGNSARTPDYMHSFWGSCS